MRMEELSNSQYIKSTDTVEKYLLNLVEEYFNNTSTASTTSREYVIKKAVERMKEELLSEDIGVLSITIPSGETRTGAVTLTLEDLQGEPIIAPKLTAFNVDFGDEANTACEGNDPRLSDARTPLDHTHEITDIVGLEGKLSTITGTLERINKLSHEHDNKDVLDIITYTGEQSSIDLILLETMGDEIAAIVEQIQADIVAYSKALDTKITKVNTEITNVKQQIIDLRDFITQSNATALAEAKQYTNDKYNDLLIDINNIINALMTRDKIQSLINIAQNTYTLAGSMTIAISTLIDVESAAHEQTKELNVSSAITTELANRGAVLTESQIEVLIKYRDNGVTHYATLPYITIVNDAIDGSINVSTICSDSKIIFKMTTINGIVPDYIKTATILYNVYSKQEVII